MNIDTSAVSHLSSVISPSQQSASTASAAADKAVQQLVSGNTAQSSANVDALNKPEHVSPEAVRSAVADGNALFANANRNLQFQIDDTTNQVVVKIVDNKTGELIRQIPTVEMLDFMRSMKAMEGKAGEILQGKA
jgi:flagellar protein FlaG